jgi:hypothetical protein
MAFNSPARAQFQRFDATGVAPTEGNPGSFAINLVDRKVWSFDNAGVPILVASGTYPHDPAKAYDTGDFVLEGTALYRADVPVVPGPFNPAQWTAIVPAAAGVPFEPAGSGVTAGGLMTINSPTQVNIAAGTGIIVVSEDPLSVTYDMVSWGAQTITVTPGGDVERVIAIDATGVAADYPLSQIDVVRRTLVFIGVTVHDDAGLIVSLCATSKVAARAADLLNDFLRAVGGPFKVDGCGVAPNGAGLTLATQTGVVFYPDAGWRNGDPNPNFVTFPSAAPVTFDTIKADGEVLSTGTTVPTSVYESGAVPVGFCTIHYLFAKPNGSRLMLQLGQTLYASLSEAQVNVGVDWEVFTAAYSPDVHVLLLAAVVVQSGATDLSDLAQARVVNVISGPQRGVVFQYPYTTSDSFLPIDGALPMTGALNMNGNAILNAIIDEGTF